MYGEGFYPDDSTSSQRFRYGGTAKGEEVEVGHMPRPDEQILQACEAFHGIRNHQGLHRERRPGTKEQEAKEGGCQMKATLPKKPNYIHGHVNLSPDKECTAHCDALVIHKGKIITPVTVRLYMGRSPMACAVHASIWIKGRPTKANPDGYWTVGRGRTPGASSGGYCKRSSAVARAIDSTGIKLSRDIDGVGMSACRDAITAIVRALGYSGEIAFAGMGGIA